MTAASIISILVATIVVILIELHYIYKVDYKSFEIQLQLDKQEAKLNAILSQLRTLQNDNEVIANNLHTIIENFNELKEEQK